MKKQSGKFVTQAELARRWGCSRANISQQISKGRIQVRKDGRIDVDQAENDLEAQVPDGMTLAEALRRKEGALAQLRELDLQKKSGAVCDVEAVSELITRFVMITKSQFLAFPTRLVATLGADDQAKRVVFKEATQCVRRILTELAALHAVDDEFCPKCVAHLHALAAKVLLPQEVFPKEAK